MVMIMILRDGRKHERECRKKIWHFQGVKVILPMQRGKKSEFAKPNYLAGKARQYNPQISHFLRKNSSLLTLSLSYAAACS